jgi:t-SNARE complex subunit (syntaxin)
MMKEKQLLREIQKSAESNQMTEAIDNFTSRIEKLEENTNPTIMDFMSMEEDSSPDPLHYEYFVLAEMAKDLTRKVVYEYLKVNIFFYSQ